jgi:hypothetical protein
MANDWYGDEWGSPGWTAQQASTVAGPETPPTSLPTNFTVVQVTAKYVDDQGNALNGSMVRFTPSVQRVTDGDTVVWLHEVNSRIEKGLLTISLLATDVVGVSPAFSWHVKECFPGGTEYDIQVPSATTSPASLFTLPAATTS